MSDWLIYLPTDWLVYYQAVLTDLLTEYLLRGSQSCLTVEQLLRYY
jgi:hypothetical protein